MSARRGSPVPSRSACSASSASPASSTVPAGVVARTTSEPSFTAVPSSGSTAAAGCGGPSTSRVRPGQDKRRPAASATSGTPATAASRAMPRSAHPGSRTGPTAIAPTARPRSAPARPPMWSACRWLSRTRAIPRTPRRARQASTGPSAGPVSISTTQPGRAVAKTTASPCPTSHATITHPAGGQPGGASRVGTTTTVAPASTASSTARRRRDRAATAMPPNAPTISSAPTGPAGQGNAVPGTAAARSATAISHAAGQPASQAHAPAAAGATGATSAASTPSTVAGATAGAASRFATTATGLTNPPKPATSGAVTRKAAAGTARASAGQTRQAARGERGRPPRRQEHERGGGRHRQREPGVDGERGIGEQQHQHRGRERGQRGSCPTHAQRHQGDRSHHRRPDHARRRPGEHHEAHEDRARHGRRQPWIGPQPPQAREHGAGQDREICPGNREQMGEPGGAEVVVHLGRERAGVADGQAGQQPGLGGREGARRVPETRPQPARRRLPPRRCRHLVGCATNPQHRDGEVGPLGRSEQAFRRDDLAGEQPAPALGGREQQHPSADRPTPRACGGRHQPGGHDDPRCGGTARRARGA